METKPANKAWQGREVVEEVGVYLQSAVVCLDGITLDYRAHNPPPQLTLGPRLNNGLHLLSTQLLATAAIKR